MKRTGKVKMVVSMLGLLAVLALAGQTFAAAKAAPTSPVDLNQSSVEQLMTIPGIGAAKAKAIVDYRTGTPFTTPEQIVNVKGIGDKMYAKISPYVAVGGKTGAAQPGTADKAVR